MESYFMRNKSQISFTTVHIDLNHTHNLLQQCNYFCTIFNGMSWYNDLATCSKSQQNIFKSENWKLGIETWHENFSNFDGQEWQRFRFFHQPTLDFEAGFGPIQKTWKNSSTQMVQLQHWNLELGIKNAQFGFPPREPGPLNNVDISTHQSANKFFYHPCYCFITFRPQWESVFLLLALHESCSSQSHMLQTRI